MTSKRYPWRVAATAALCCGIATSLASADATFTPEPRPRRPVAIVAAESWLYVANARGSVSVIDANAQTVVNEFDVGASLADMASANDERLLLAVDASSGHLIALRRSGPHLTIIQRLPLAASPVTVAVSLDGRSCSVASLWSRRVTLIDIREGRSPLHARAIVDLPLSARMQAMLPDGRSLIVADAFGGLLGIVDIKAARLIALRSIDGHNIRGLSLSGDGARLLIAHQQLNPYVETTQARVTWGAVIDNLLRGVEVAHLLNLDQPAETDVPVPIARWTLEPLGENGHGAGDPGTILRTPAGHLAVCLSGVHEVTVRRAGYDRFNRIAVGRRPVALACDSSGRVIYVANMFDDSITVIDAADRRVTGAISLGPTGPIDLVERGRMLFHDATLAHDGWYSCHSCHTDGHTNGLLNDNFSDGTFGTPKRVLSLLGTGRTTPWAWNGERLSLDMQVRNSIEGTMQGKSPGHDVVEAIVRFIETLEPPPSVNAARGTIDHAAMKRGEAIFERLDCTRCHQPPRFTSSRTFDVGLVDEWGRDRFNPPSLLGVSQQKHLLHDNRAHSLRDLLVRVRHPDGEARELSLVELDDLIHYLKGL